MSIAKSGFIFGLGTIFSRLSGLLRDIILASIFGATLYLDAFLVAMRVPNLLREMLAEGSLGSAFTKVYTKVYTSNKTEAAHVLKLTLSAVVWSAFIISICCFILAPFIVKTLMMLTPDSKTSLEFFINATSLARLLTPVLGFMMVGAVLMGALHQFNRFFLTATAPILFNIGYIVGATVFVDLVNKPIFNNIIINNFSADPSIVALAIGVVLGAFLQIVVQFIGLKKSTSVRFYINPTVSRLKEIITNRYIINILTLMLPMVVAASAGQINLIINTIFATSLEQGSVSWLSFAFRLLYLPIGAFGVALSVSALPQLTRQIEKDSGTITKSTALQAQSTIQLVFWLMVPCMMYYLLKGQNVIILLFEHGKFTPQDSFNTSSALFVYSFGLLAYGLIKVLTSFYFVLGRTKFAMNVSIMGVLINLVVNYLFITKYQYLALCYSFVFSLIFNASFLLFGLRKDAHHFSANLFVKNIIMLIIVSVIFYFLVNLDMFSFFDRGSEVLDKAENIYKLVSDVLVAAAIMLVLYLGGFIFLRKKL